jgi:hypothetical protein
VPQGSDPEVVSRFILATNLYEEKVPNIRVFKTVTPQCEFNYVNIKRRKMLKNECIFYRVQRGTYQRSVNMEVM